MQYLPLLLALLLFACGQNNQSVTTVTSGLDSMQKENKQIADSYAEPQARREINTTKDTLYQLLDAAVKQDSVEFFNFSDGLIFLKTGYLLSTQTKQALLIYPKGKENYSFEFYNFAAGKWVIKNKENLGFLFPVNFNLVCEDYNFDGITDLYIQATCSNGIAISHGHLLTQDITGKLKLHSECYDFGNMTPDAKRKVVTSIEYIDCAPNNDYPSGSICKLTHQWKNGKLEQVKKDCPCEAKN
jgi:hypothetical protein